MFNNEDEYKKATREAQLYTSVAIKSSNKKLIIFNFILLGLLAYATFYYVKNNTNILSSSPYALLPVSQQAVLGVSETIDDSELSNERLIEILRGTKVDEVEDLANSMKVLVDEPSIQSKSSYTQAIARELDDKSGFRGRIAVVKYGDTLSSLSEKYYGNSRMFSKIISGNKNLINRNSMLIVGQTINIPN